MTLTKQLKARVKTLNMTMGFEIEPYTIKNFRLAGNPNVYFIEKAYGGYRLCQICKDGRGSKNIIKERTTKPKLIKMIDMILYGINLSREGS